MEIYPKYVFQDVTKIDPQVLEGKRLLIFDIDNTLFYSETINTRKDIIVWFKKTHKKYPCVCFSNSFSIIKRKPFLEDILDCRIYLSNYKKPSKELFKEITEHYKVSAKDVAVIGDFHFTDVLFANINNAISILVKPIGGEKRLSLMVARVLENFIYSLSDFLYSRRF